MCSAWSCDQVCFLSQVWSLWTCLRLVLLQLWRRPQSSAPSAADGQSESCLCPLSESSTHCRAPHSDCRTLFPISHCSQEEPVPEPDPHKQRPKSTERHQPRQRSVRALEGFEQVLVGFRAYLVISVSLKCQGSVVFSLLMRSATCCESQSRTTACFRNSFLFCQ